jgi:hypothetical protein
MEAGTQTGGWQSMTAVLHGADLTGLCLLTALLAVSAWTCLRPPPVLRHSRPSAAQTFGFYLLLCAIAAPLLMFASLASGLGQLQKTQPLLAASSHWQPYRTLLWMLYGVVGLQQLFALQRLGFWPAPRTPRLMPLATTALVLLPLAMALGLLALDRFYFRQQGMPHDMVATAAIASISGIALWLPAQMMASRTQASHRAAPGLAAAMPAGYETEAAMPVADPGSQATTLNTAQEMERQLNELSALLEQEKRESELASQRELLEKEEALHGSTIQQQVHEQKFLFESGLPCNLGMLVNGLVILDQPMDLRDHVRGDSLLHAAVRDTQYLLAQSLIDNGAPLDAVNWAGLTPRACTQDPVMLELLDAAALRSAK